MDEYINLFISGSTMTFILSLVTAAFVTSVVVILILRRRSERLRGLAVAINSIPFLAGLLPLSELISILYLLTRALTSTIASGVSDPRVVAAGISEFFFLLALAGGLFFIFLEVWLIIRMLYGSFIRELDTIPT